MPSGTFADYFALKEHFHRRCDLIRAERAVIQDIGRQISASLVRLESLDKALLLTQVKNDELEAQALAAFWKDFRSKRAG
jgi:hypothetical protein